MRLSALSPFALLVLPCLSAPAESTNSHVLHEKRSSLHPLWTRHSRVPGDHVLPIRIGLKQRNLEHADRFIHDVAHPSSPNFGRHWTAKQVAETFAPAQEAVEGVVGWLVEAGIERDRVGISKGMNWVEFDATISEAESLFDAQYHYFEHGDGGFRIACDSYGLPGHVREHVDFVMPTIQLEGLRPVGNVSPNIAVGPLNITGLNGTATCDRLVTIDCLRALYGFGPGNSSHAGNQLGIPEWADYLYLPDLKVFLQNFTQPPIPPDTVPEFLSIDGGKASNLTQAEQGNVVESALDFQTSYSIIWPQQIRHYQVGDGVNVDSVGTFNIFLDALDASYCTYLGGDQPYVDPEYPDPNLDGYVGPLQCGGAPVSNVFSVSYGQIEGALPVFYQQRQCYEWMKLALQGVTVVFASGDSGVANRYNSGYNNSCLNAEYGYVDSNGTVFSPSFPVNCPYITTVGATQLNGSIAGGEVAVASPHAANHLLDYYSGGGFSSIFPRPSWQDGPVKAYLARHAPDYAANVFNRHGRAFPDLAALGRNLTTVYLNQTYGIGGTSASAPIVASLITLINEERLRAGKGPVGFINPTLYAHPEMFNDIVEGSNPGCGTEGFRAAPGWDPVTGMGTPRYEKMKEVFLSLP